MMRLNKIILIPAILLTSCATNEKIVTHDVNIPQLACPKPIILEKPKLPINSLVGTESIGEVALAYKATVWVLMDYINQQERIINLYSQ